jgi:hypothetical protein
MPLTDVVPLLPVSLLLVVPTEVPLVAEPAGPRVEPSAVDEGDAVEGVAPAPPPLLPVLPA